MNRTRLIGRTSCFPPPKPVHDQQGTTLYIGYQNVPIPKLEIACNVPKVKKPYQKNQICITLEERLDNTVPKKHRNAGEAILRQIDQAANGTQNLLRRAMSLTTAPTSGL